MFVLRNYQSKAVEAVKNHIEKGVGNALCVIPTGGGKSVVIAAAAEAIGGHILVLQPSKEILEQNYKKMLACGISENEVGIYSASFGIKEIKKITFATIGSIVKKKEEFLHFENIFVDEAHFVNSDGGQYEELFSFLQKKIVGFTATPFRLSSKMLMDGTKIVQAKMLNRTRPRIFSKIIHTTQIEEISKHGFLAKLEYKEKTAIHHENIKLNTTGMDFDERALKIATDAAKIDELVLKEILENASKHILVFCSFLSDAEKIAKFLNTKGVPSCFVCGDTPKKEREQILEDFKNGVYRVVTNVGVLTTGFDFPELDCVILTRPTQSIALYYQMTGRALRPHPNKKSGLIIDFCGNVKRFGKVENFEFVGDFGKERLKGEKGFLTGFDFVANYDLEMAASERYSLKRIEEKKQQEQEQEDLILPFGKYAGQRLSALPFHFLTWAVENLQSEKWRRIFKNEIEKRRKAELS